MPVFRHLKSTYWWRDSAEQILIKFVFKMRCCEIKRSLVKLVAFSFRIKAKDVTWVLVGDGLAPSFSSWVVSWFGITWELDGWIPVTDGCAPAPLKGGMMPKVALRQVYMKVLALDRSSSCPGCCSQGGTSCSNPEAIPTSFLVLRWPDIWSSMIRWAYTSDTKGPCVLPGPMASAEQLSSRIRYQPVSYFIWTPNSNAFR